MSKEFQALLAGLVREHLPAEYVKTTDWGQQKNLTTGVRLRLDGWRLKARRRKKEVNHGSWKRYRITVLNPEKNFKLHVAHVRKTDDGKLAFQVITRAKLRAFGRWSQWQRGIQLVSLSAEADAEVVLRADCRLALRLDPSSIPPDVLLDPEVVSADIRLVDFRLRQLSNVKGRLANQFGKGLERIVEDKLEAKRRELPSKINRQIDKHRDKLRFSLRDLWSSPLREAGSLLSSTNADPASTRNATAGSDKAASDSASTP